MQPSKPTAQALGELSEKRRNRPICNHTLGLAITAKSETEFDWIVKSFEPAIRKNGRAPAAKKLLVFRLTIFWIGRF
jgi:hypothetical protein